MNQKFRSEPHDVVHTAAFYCTSKQSMACPATFSRGPPVCSSELSHGPLTHTLEALNEHQFCPLFFSSLAHIQWTTNREREADYITTMTTIRTPCLLFFLAHSHFASLQRSQAINPHHDSSLSSNTIYLRRRTMPPLPANLDASYLDIDTSRHRLFHS